MCPRLLPLARGETVLGTVSTPATPAASWLKAFEHSGCPPPDPAAISFAGRAVEFVWKKHFVAATVGPITDEMAEDASAKGWEMVALSVRPEDGVPRQLVALLKGAA